MELRYLPFILLLVFSTQLQANRGTMLEAVTVSAGQSGATLIPPEEDRAAILFEQARAVSVLDGSDWSDSAVTSQEDTLKRAPGVWVANQNGGADVFLSIRGSGLSATAFGRGVNSYQDRIPLGRLDSGTTNQLIDSSIYDYAEIYRGASSLELGSTASGGAINYASRTGDRYPGWQLRSEVGSFGWRQNRVAWGGASERTDAYVSVSQSDLEGFREQSREYNRRFHGNAGYRFDGGVENRTYLLMSDARLELPGSLAINQLDKDRRREAAAFNTQFDSDRNWREIRLANRTLVPVAEHQHLIASVFINQAELDHLPSPFVGIIDNQYGAVGVGLEYELQGDNGQRFVTGLRHGEGRDIGQRYRQSDDGQKKLDRVYDERFRVSQTEWYGEYTQPVSDRLRAVVGGQWTRSDRRSQDRLVSAPPPCIPPNCTPFPQPTVSPGDDSWQETLGGWSPKAALMYLPTLTQRIYVQVARNIGLPSSGEQGVQPVPGSRIREETSLTSEVGYRGIGDFISWDLVAYRARFKGELLNLEIDGVTSLFNAPTPTLHDGIEVGMTVHLPARWLAADELDLQLVYNWSDFRFEDDPDYARASLPKIPEHVLFAAVQWRLHRGLLIEPSTRYVSGYPLTFDNEGGDNWHTVSYALIGLKVSQQFSSSLTLFAEGRNLTDRVYVSTGATTPSPAPPSMFNPDPAAQVTPGVGRAFYAGFNYTF
ncbi:MAG: hypothetical protein CVV10_09475 [Gammaproteobacteria bacterium HGW-Gammaproteobacteria-14]|nr:MAG: hypothetical protein CVV10_09475 [Gammaproteobacteria bacterium HGW-Gammaproteobacteria-14]